MQLRGLFLVIENGISFVYMYMYRKLKGRKSKHVIMGLKIIEQDVH